MRRNIFVILLIFIVPAIMYYFLQKEKISSLPSYATINKPTIMKFYSPMCSECRELEKVIEKVYPNYSDKADLRNINVTVNNNETKNLIKENNVTLVPTTVFRFSDGNVYKRVEGTMNPTEFDGYIKGIISE